jgi:GNAT superfamily N-acetyltransferase
MGGGSATDLIIWTAATPNATLSRDYCTDYEALNMIETIEQLTADRVDWLSAQFAELDGSKPAGYFQQCFAEQERGELIVLLSRTGEHLNGYLKIVWRTGYAPFRDAGIPEIVDLNVVPPTARHHGIGTRLMDRAEAMVARTHPVIGIGVGLHPGYCAAQRMYIVRGYIPDARPLTYNDEFVTEGQTVQLDDSLVLHLAKRLVDA